MDKLKKIEEIAKILEGDRITRAEMEAAMKAFFGVIREMRVQMGKDADRMKTEMADAAERKAKELERMMAKGMKDAESEGSSERRKSHAAMLRDVRMMRDELMKQVESVREGIIEEVMDAVPNIDEIEKDLPKLGMAIRDGLELLKDDDRLDKSAIKGLEKVMSQSDLDRAVSILDSRTSFLINKVSNLAAQGTGSGGSGGGGTWGSITGTLSSQTDLQSALDLKAPLASPTFTGTVTAPDIDNATTTVSNYVEFTNELANTLLALDGSKRTLSLSTSTYPSLTELSYVKGVTSAIQTQLNTKQATISLTTTGTSGAATFIANVLNIPQYQAAGTYVTSVSGTTNRITSSGGTTPAIDIAATYVGQTSITTLGTITTGVWTGTAIGQLYGGTGATSYGANRIIFQNSGNTAFTSAAAFTYNGTDVALTGGRISQAGTAAGTGYLRTNSGGLASTTSLNPGISLFGGGAGESLYGADLGYNSTSGRYRVRIITGSSGTDIGLGYGTANPPTGQSDFTEVFTITGQGNVGVNKVQPAAKFNVVDGVADFRFSSGSGSVTPTIAMLNTGASGKAIVFGCGTSGGYMGFDNAGDFFFKTETRANINANATGAGTDVGFIKGSNGDWGIGTISTQARLHLEKTTEQFRVGYDSSNYFSATVGSTGGVTFDAVGSAPGFSFSDAVTASMASASTAVTQSAGDSSTKIATTAFVQQEKVGYWISCTHSSVNPADAETRVFGNNTASNTTITNFFHVYIPKSGTIKSANIYSYVAGTLGSGESSTFNLVLNNTTTVTLTSTFTHSATNNSQTVTPNTAVTAGDYFEIRWVSPTWATNPLSVTNFVVLYIE